MCVCEFSPIDIEKKRRNGGFVTAAGNIALENPLIFLLPSFVQRVCVCVCAVSVIYVSSVDCAVSESIIRSCRKNGGGVEIRRNIRSTYTNYM